MRVWYGQIMHVVGITPVLATLLIRSNFWQMAVLRAWKSGIMLVNPETDLELAA